MRKRVAGLSVVVLLAAGLTGSALAAEPGPIQLPAVQLTVTDACTGVGVSGASVSVSDAFGASFAPSRSAGSSFTFDRLDMADALLHVGASGYQPLGDPTAANPGVWLFKSGDDFAISLGPQSATVTPGDAVSAAVKTQTMGGSGQSIALSVTGAPSGVTASLSQATVSSGGSATLTVATTPSVAPGAYPLTVTGTATSLTHSAVFLLTVKPAVHTTLNDFAIGVAPTSANITTGGSFAATVTTTIAQGSAQPISLSAAGLPAGITAAFGSSSVTAGGSTTLTFAANSAASNGVSNITIIGTAASGTHSIPFALYVSGATGNPPPAGPLAYSSLDTAATFRPIGPITLDGGATISEGLKAAVLLTPAARCANPRPPAVPSLTVTANNAVTGLRDPGPIQVTLSDPTIQIDAHGRVKAAFHWDRMGTPRVSITDPRYAPFDTNIPIQPAPPLLPSGAISVSLVVNIGLEPIDQNSPPHIDALTASSVNPTIGTPVTLNAVAHEPENEALTYAWTSVAGCTFSDPTIPNTTITCTNPGSTAVTLTVTDTHALSTAQTFTLLYRALPFGGPGA